MKALDLDSIIKTVNDLPSLPHLVVKIMQLTDNPHVTARDINEVLSQDQGLVAKVLRMANSAYYGFSRHISTVTDAVICLGFKTVRSIVMAASVNDLLNRELKGYGLNKGYLWKHSQDTAAAARLIAMQNCPDVDCEVAYTAALLHDIGKIILDAPMRDLYAEVLSTASQNNISFYDAETKVLGFNHALAGSRVVERWNLPAELVESIAFHHTPEQAVLNPKLAALLCFSNALTISLVNDTPTDLPSPPYSLSVIKLLDLDELAAHQIAFEIKDLLTKV
ncbi:MAG: HDOD domain-containing protein [Syntrophomonadaceae bacterium]|nr:HDOD domain-containing protein [Syntrophomonadaceae bacterium]